MIKEKLALAAKLHNDSDRLLNLTMSLSGVNMTFVNYGTFGSFRINATNWCGLSFNINLSISKVSSTSIDEIVNDLVNNAENIKISDIEVHNTYEILKHASRSSHDSYESCTQAFDSFKVDVILKYGAWPFEGLDSIEDKLRSKLAEFILSESTFSRSAKHLQRHVIARCMSPLKNTGKTTLLKTLENALVVSRDGKPFSLELPHFNVGEYTSIDELLDLLLEKLEAYKAKIGTYPDTVVFDSVSRIFTDIETNCSRKYNGYDVWSNVNKEINIFIEAVNDLQNQNYNVVLIAHAVWDETAKKYIETCKGSFAKTGGFLSTVDYAINIDVVGKKRILTHRGSSLSRTLLTEVPEKESADEFSLQEYLNKIKTKSEIVQDKWSI